MLCVYSLMNTS